MASQSFIARVANFVPSGVLVGDRGRAAARGEIDERRYLRSPISAYFELGWQDPGGWCRQTQARGVNMSIAGAALLSPEPIPVGCRVYLHSKEMQVMGGAVVRHCTGQKSKFLIGVEFEGSFIRPF